MRTFAFVPEDLLSSLIGMRPAGKRKRDDDEDGDGTMRPPLPTPEAAGTSPDGRVVAAPPAPTSQHTGVSWNKEKRKWRAAIWVNGKQRILGQFAAEGDAVAARREAMVAKSGAEKAAGGRGAPSSHHIGVSWHTSSRKWRAKITVDGKQHILGLFADEEEAAEARRRAMVAKAQGAPLPARHKEPPAPKEGAPAPSRSRFAELLAPAPPERSTLVNSNGVPQSHYLGVCWDKVKGKWKSRYKARYLGAFSDELDAARAAEAARQNLPAPSAGELAALPLTKRVVKAPVKQSSFRGVCWYAGPRLPASARPSAFSWRGGGVMHVSSRDKRTSRWKARVKMAYLGYFDDEEEASRAVEAAELVTPCTHRCSMGI